MAAGKKDRIGARPCFSRSLSMQAAAQRIVVVGGNGYIGSPYDLAAAVLIAEPIEQAQQCAKLRSHEGWRL
jgi:hypothetical protein